MKVIENYNNSVVDIILINYSNKFYTRAQIKNTKSAIKLGCFKKVISYCPDDIDDHFFEANKEILESERGGGYWLWKPYFIKKSLLAISDGDFLFYCDSGSRFINSVAGLMNFVKSTNQDIVPFENQTIESQYTKRDCFVLTNTDEEMFVKTKQRLATFSVWKKSEAVLKFLDDWLFFAQDKRIITDLENKCGYSNYVGFIDHRHDQSLFSLLTKKYDLTAYRDPSQYGNMYTELYPTSNYSQLLISTRQKNISMFEFLKKKIRPFIPVILRKTYLTIKKINFIY